jgi:hypothetical protein
MQKERVSKLDGKPFAIRQLEEWKEKRKKYSIMGYLQGSEQIYYGKSIKRKLSERNDV